MFEHTEKIIFTQAATTTALYHRISAKVAAATKYNHIVWELSPSETADRSLDSAAAADVKLSAARVRTHNLVITNSASSHTRAALTFTGLFQSSQAAVYSACIFCRSRVCVCCGPTVRALAMSVVLITPRTILYKFPSSSCGSLPWFDFLVCI